MQLAEKPSSLEKTTLVRATVWDGRLMNTLRTSESEAQRPGTFRASSVVILSVYLATWIAFRKILVAGIVLCLLTPHTISSSPPVTPSSASSLD
jgi:hypothetical protein